MVTEVIKRDGNVEEFKPYKIDNVIELAFNNVNESHDRTVFDNVLKILKKSESKVSVEHIQDIIETQLYKKKHFDVLKSFIEYRQTHKVQRFLKKDKTTFVDCNQTIDEYVDKVDWRILANSNTGYSHAGLVNNTAGKVIANYWLDKVYSPEEAKAHRDGDYHIHDLDNLSGYCAGWSLRALLDEGFNGVRGRVDADAPNHLSSALGQMVNFLGILQSEWAGAQAFSSFDTYLAPYLFKDCLTDEQLYKEMQSFVYNLNVPSRWGQSPFTNVTIDVTVPEDLKNQIPTRKQRHIFSDIDVNSDLGKKLLNFCKKRGKEKLIDMTYSDFQPELERIDIAFYKVLTEGDLHSQPFTFPIPTVNITEDFDWDSKAANAIFENAAKMGSSYFQNFIGSQYIINENGERVPNEKAYKPGAVRSMCCRLQLDLRELLKRGGGLFGSAEMTGCYDDQTEILTDSGWKYFKDLNGTETVLTMDSNKDISWNKIEQLHQYDIDDNMYHFKRRNVTEMVVTPNHRMLVSDKKGTKFEVKRADEVFKSKKEYIVPKNNAIKQNISKSIKIGSLEFDTFTFYRFLGAYLGDGSFVYNEERHNYNVNIAQKDTDKNFESIKKIVDAMNMKYTYSSGCFNIYNKELANYMKQFGKAHDKFVPKKLFFEDASVINAFLEGFRLTDYCNKYFYTCSPQLKDDLQVLLQLVGISSRARIHRKHPFTVDFGNGRAAHSNYDLWEICEHRTRSKSFMKDKLEIKPYKGKVYCVTVPNNTVCVRRNGNINWSGNSVGVVTLNLARLGYLFKGDSENLYKRLDYLMDLAKSTLIKKRAIIQDLFERGLFPYTKRYLPGFNNHFSTIGINGANEMIRNFTNDKESIVTEFGQKFAYDLLEHMRTRIREFQESTGYLFNLEATPAEGTTYRFAKEDLKRYPDILQAGFGSNIYYTNSSQIPANYTDDVFEALELNDALQCEYTGGTVLHMYMVENLRSGADAKKLIKNAISNFRLPYLTITPVFSICPKHGYISGDHEFCPKCDAELLEQQNRSCGNDC